MRVALAQATGAFHSRTIEKKIAAAKSAKMKWFRFTTSIVALVG